MKRTRSKLQNSKERPENKALQKNAQSKFAKTRDADAASDSQKTIKVEAGKQKLQNKYKNLQQ